MKSQTAKSKSTITHIVAACLVLAVLGPPAAELSRASGRGDPPGGIHVTFTLSGMCGFDVQVDGHLLGVGGVVSLPGGNILVTGSGFNTFTNLSDPSKSVTLNVAGSGMLSTDENGNTVIQAFGFNQVWGPLIGIKYFTGELSFVQDQDGNVICPPGVTCTQFTDYVTGNGQITDVCALIQ
jgi:hypothetical protein